MKAEYQSKLMTAFVSLCILFIAQFFFLFSHDLFYDSHIYPMGVDERFAYDYWNTLGNLIVVGTFGVPVAVWHVSDLLNSREPKTKLAAFIVSYRLVLYLMLLGLVGYTIIASGLTERLSCHSAYLENTDGDNFFSTCTPELGHLMEYLVLPFLGTLMILALFKLAYAILSLFRKKT